MSKLTSLPGLILPEVREMNYVFSNCSNLTGTVVYDTVKVGVVWNNAFENDRSLQYVSTKFFQAGSEYLWTFKNCTGLMGIDDLRYNDSITLKGWSHQNTFNGCTNLSVAYSYNPTTKLQFSFPESRTIAGCFWHTNVVGSGPVRDTLMVRAEHAEYADHFIDYEQDEGIENRAFNTIYLVLPKCLGANFMFGKIKVIEDYHLEVLTPDNSNAVNHNIIINNLFTNTETSMVFYRNGVAYPDMYRGLSPAMEEIVKYCGYSGWKALTFSGVTITMDNMNQIQNCSASGQIKFINCTFTNPSGITTLNPPANHVTFLCSGSTGLDILSGCLGANQGLSGN